MAKNIIGGLVISIATLGLVLAAIQVQERNECIEWNRYAAESKLVGLESEQWQKDQCLNYNIKLEY